MKPRCGPATTLATASGREIAQFFGTSSPTTISTTVDDGDAQQRSPRWRPRRRRPTASSGPRSRAASDGSASMPITSEVTVMPSWAPESWKVSRRTAFRAPSAPRSPAAAARSRSPRSTVVRENSAATNTAQARVSSEGQQQQQDLGHRATPAPSPMCGGRAVARLVLGGSPIAGLLLLLGSIGSGGSAAWSVRQLRPDTHGKGSAKSPCGGGSRCPHGWPFRTFPAAADAVRDGVASPLCFYMRVDNARGGPDVPGRPADDRQGREGAHRFEQHIMRRSRPPRRHVVRHIH